MWYTWRNVWVGVRLWSLVVADSPPTDRGFNKPLLRRVGFQEGRALFKLHEPLVYQTQLNSAGGLTITVPAGFVTDFTSIPRRLRWLFNPIGPWDRAAALHDYLYSLPGVSRFLADALFREAMYRLGVPLWRRVLMYYAVRVFGARHRNITP